MDMVPERLWQFETLEDGNVQVLYPRFTSGWLQRWLLPRLKNPFIRINLDRIGSSVWKNVDGQRTVYQISLLVSEALGEPPDENWHYRVGTFMRILHKKDLVTFHK